MGKIISFMHMSLDGFVAGPNGEMDWIKVNDEIFDYVSKRINESDTALYGRLTYRMMEDYWPTAGNKPGASKHDIEHSKWYMNAHKIVLSKTLKEEGLSKTTIINNNLPERLEELKQKAGKEILLFGSPRATHSLNQLGLIDGYWLFINPIILGNGIPLFKDIRDRTKLNLLNTHRFECGVTALSYEVEGR
ncbi:MAG: dihydrofolate reductase family protein [Bacteroidetes bacterium]|nr:dihydrofolate reductase family protein [Bacteroidota bacterium]